MTEAGKTPEPLIDNINKSEQGATHSRGHFDELKPPQPGKRSTSATDKEEQLRQIEEAQRRQWRNRRRNR